MGEDIVGVCAKGTPIFKWSEGHSFTEGPACAPDGTMYFTDVPSRQIPQLDPAGAKTGLKDSKRMNGLFFSKEGMLYGCQGGGQSILPPEPSAPCAARVRAAAGSRHP